MPSPLVVVIFVATAEASTPATKALVTATEDALDGATVTIRPVATLPDDEEAARVADELHADATVEVTWSLADRAHLHVCAQKKCTDRDLAFTPKDDPSQRGRAMGLAIATMIPAPAPAPAIAPAPAPAPAIAPAPAPAIARAAAPAIAIAPARWRIEVDAAFAAATGASGIGYEAAARVHAPGAWSIGGGIGARFGHIEAAAIQATTVRVSVGVGLDVVRSERFVATIYVDGLALRHDLHRHYGGELVEHARWIGGFDVLGSASFAFTDTLAIFASGGLELGFGETTVIVGQDAVATIPRVRGLFLAGLRLRF